MKLKPAARKYRFDEVPPLEDPKRDRLGRRLLREDEGTHAGRHEPSTGEPQELAAGQKPPPPVCDLHPLPSFFHLTAPPSSDCACRGEARDELVDHEIV